MSRPCAYVPATSVIDPTAPGGIEAMLAFHRATFGDARMDAGSGDAGSGEVGGSGDGGSGTGEAGSGDTGQGGSTGTTSTSSSAEQSGQDGAQQQAGQGLPDDPEALKAEIARLRRENAADRTNAKQAAADEARKELAREVGKALGLVQDDGDDPDPEKLAQETEQLRTETRVARIELAVYRGASKHQGDPDALLDSRTFLEKVAALDPKAEDFTSKIDAAIKDAVEKNPKLKAAPVATTSSVDHAGGTGDSTRRTPKPLTDAVRAAYGSN